MRKRVISLICTLALMLSMVITPNVSAAAISEDNMKNVLVELDILNWTDMSIVTKEKFVYSMAGFLYEGVESKYTAREVAEKLGIIKKSDSFKKDDEITTDEAVRYALITLGYGDFIKDKTKQEWLTLASQANILKGVTTGGGYLTAESGVKLLRNMLDANPMVSYIKSGNEKVYKVDTSETLLSLYRKIYKAEGTVTATPMTSLYSEIGTKEGYIKIGNDEYIIADDSDIDFLGRYVYTYYIENDADERQIIAITESERNESLVIDAKDIIEAKSDYSGIVYKDENGRRKEADLAAAPDVIYNGVYFGGYSISDLEPEIGNIELISRDGNKKYDVVKITSYETMIVDSVGTRTGAITNKYNHSGSLSAIKLLDDDVKYIIYKNGKSVGIDGITVGDVLSVARSKDGKTISIVVSQTKLTGTLKGIDREENILTIDEEEYFASEEFIRSVLKNPLDENDQSLTIEHGRSYTFSIDAYSNISYAEKLLEEDYVVWLKIKYDNSEDIYNMTYMDMDEVWHTSPLAEKVTYNGTRLDDDDIYTKLSVENPQIMLFKQNKKGEIKEIGKAVEKNDYDKDNITITEETQCTFRTSVQAFDCLYFLNDGAKAVIFPETVSYDKSEYMVRRARDYFSSDKAYKMRAFNVDEFNFTDVIQTTYTQDVNMKNNLFVVTKKFYQLDADDEIRQVIQCNVEAYRNLTFRGADENTFDGINVGEVVKLQLDMTGDVRYAKTVYSLNGTFEGSGSAAYNANNVVGGTISELSLSDMRMMLQCGANKVPVRLDSTATVQLFTQGENICEVASIAELRKGAKVVCRMNLGKLKEVVMIKE